MKQKLAPLFEAVPEIGFVYLFGSQAKNATGPMSDFDFAVYLDEKDAVKRGNLLFKLSSDISGALNTDAIDIHCLNDLESPELKYNILKDGVIFFERGPFRIFVEPKILNEYFDFVYLLRKYKLTKA